MSIVLWLLLASAVPVWSRARKRRQALVAGASWLVSSAAALVLFPMILLIAMLFTDVQVLYSGVTPVMRLIFLLPWLAALLAIGGVVAAMTDRGTTGTRTGRLYWAAVAVTSIAALVFLRFNLLWGWPA